MLRIPFIILGSLCAGLGAAILLISGSYGAGLSVLGITIMLDVMVWQK
jgi:hypothetical protein